MRPRKRKLAKEEGMQAENERVRGQKASQAVTTFMGGRLQGYKVSGSSIQPMVFLATGMHRYRCKPLPHTNPGHASHLR